uniref:Minor capsid protein P9 transmembrane helices domain-containing protein n=1 Tax=viral metagenome TaxID=1070528 RepID=A0A6C0E2Z4_9ZZZZ
MTTYIPFWSNDPTILFNKTQLGKLWPQSAMAFEENLNAISRLIILLSVLGFLFTLNLNFLLIGIITLFVVLFIYKMRKTYIIKTLLEKKEGFSDMGHINVIPEKTIPLDNKLTNPVTLESVLRSDFYPTTKKNPLGNVLLTEIMDDPDRKAAAPSFNVDVSEDITRSAKKTVQYLNPDIKNTNKQLFGDLANNFELDWSMRNFYSMPNTRVTNDQGAYGEYLYGNMPSAKEGNAFALVQDNLRYILI